MEVALPNMPVTNTEVGSTTPKRVEMETRSVEVNLSSSDSSPRVVTSMHLNEMDAEILCNKNRRTNSNQDYDVLASKLWGNVVGVARFVINVFKLFANLFIGSFNFLCGSPLNCCSETEEKDLQNKRGVERFVGVADNLYNIARGAYQSIPVIGQLMTQGSLIETLTANVETLTANVETLTANVETLTANVETLTASVETLKEQANTETEVT